MGCQLRQRVFLGWVSDFFNDRPLPKAKKAGLRFASQTKKDGKPQPRRQTMAIDGLRMPLFDVWWHNNPLDIDSQPPEK